MALYGVYGSHTTEACPVNNREVAEKIVAFAESDVSGLAGEYKINEVIGQYHSAFEHTFVWIIDAEDPHLVEEFCLDAGLASFNNLRIVPMKTFAEGVLPRVRKVHGL
ncbi:MAG: hypothetical protein ACE5KS_02495 [Woeseiaceae bacterium]